MKHGKKIFLGSVIAFLAFAAPSLYSSPLGVLDISVAERNSVDIIFSDTLNIAPGEVSDAEIIVLKDMKVSMVHSENIEEKSLEIQIEEPILPNTRYNLITVAGTEGSIDFMTPDAIEWYTTNNFTSVKDEDIESIEILDSNTLVVRFRNELANEAYAFNFLEENPVAYIVKDEFHDAKLTLTLENPLSSVSSYIVMLLTLKDSAGRILDFDTGMYDFMTEQFSEEETQEIVIENVYENENMNQEEVEMIEEEIYEEEVELYAAAEREMGMEEEQPQEEEGNVEEIAQINTHNPDTGAATWILIFATIIINTFFYITRRKQALLS